MTCCFELLVFVVTFFICNKFHNNACAWDRVVDNHVLILN